MFADSLRKLYADQAHWPSTFQKPFGDDAGAFIGNAMAESHFATFKAECADARRLKHPNLLEVVDFGETGAVEPATDDGYWSYIVTEPTDEDRP